MKTKNFDCVAMKRAAADKIYEQIKDASPAEQCSFWKIGEAELLYKCRGVITSEPVAKAA
jgi:hypothetical protein